MDRIAIISDIHGNLTALNAVLDDIRSRSITRIICLGDLVGKGPHSDLAIDLCRKACELVVRGNWDDFILRDAPSPAIAWHQQQLGPERLAYLASLPYTIDFMLSGQHVRLFHASQISIYHRVHMYDSRETHHNMFANTDFTGYNQTPNIVGYGDIHSAYVKSFDQNTLFNTGSVGNPLDVSLASYAILEGNYGSDQRAGFGVQLVRVLYDIEAELREAERMQMPELDEYADELRTGRYRGLKKR